ncbi:hypothetical protein ATZ33_05930 [Enterococcus silesiacus]|nr:hypothetical protein [Enterococcus silesiacus]ALS00923.1 hypothetical protein ATZ33_05930 [Enterococcus silesiacus]
MIQEREEAKRLRKQLLALLNQDSDWFRKGETEMAKTIRDVGKQLYSAEAAAVANINKLTVAHYNELRTQGLYLREIATRYKSNENALRVWRKKHKEAIID